MSPEHQQIARSSLLLKGTPPAVVEAVMATARVREFDRGSTIFLQGERASAIYIVAEGWVKLYRISPSGAEAVVAVFTKGSSFGEAVAFRHDVYPVAAEAVTDCNLIRIEANTILNLIRQSPEIAISILSATFLHLHSLVAQVEQLKARTGAQRVAEFLLELSQATEGSCVVTLPYDKALIAGRLGMKPESLSRAFAKLRVHGVTIRQNNATIADLAALRELSDEDPALSWTKS
jgi:CRP-like cAMP-binding protein